MKGFTIIDKNSDYYIKRSIDGLIEYAEINLYNPDNGLFFKSDLYEVSIKPIYSGTFKEDCLQLIKQAVDESPDSLLLFIGNSFSVTANVYCNKNVQFTFRNMVYKVPFILRDPMIDKIFNVTGYAEGAYIYGKFVRITRINKDIPIINFDLGNNNTQITNK